MVLQKQSKIVRKDVDNEEETAHATKQHMEQRLLLVVVALAFLLMLVALDSLMKAN